MVSSAGRSGAEPTAMRPHLIKFINHLQRTAIKCRLKQQSNQQRHLPKFNICCERRGVLFHQPSHPAACITDAQSIFHAASRPDSVMLGCPSICLSVCLCRQSTLCTGACGCRHRARLASATDLPEHVEVAVKISTHTCRVAVGPVCRRLWCMQRQLMDS